MSAIHSAIVNVTKLHYNGGLGRQVAQVWKLNQVPQTFNIFIIFSNNFNSIHMPWNLIHLKINMEGWACRSGVGRVGQCLSSMQEALGSTLNIL